MLERLCNQCVAHTGAEILLMVNSLEHDFVVADLQDILQHGAQDKEEVMAHADSLTMQQTQQIMDAVQAMQR